MHVSTRIDLKALLRGGVLRRFRPFFWMFVVLAGLVGVVFALSNREVLLIQLLPLPFTIEAPVYLILMSMLFLGVLLGGVGAWVSSFGERYKARNQSRRVKWLEAKLEEERGLRRDSLGDEGKRRARILGQNALKSDHPDSYSGRSA
mgnify:FL=1